MNNINQVMAAALKPFAPPSDQNATGGLPIIEFNSKWRASRPCVVERDGMRFVHDPEVASRTDKFFGVIK